MSDLISRSKLQFAIKRNQTIMRDGEHYIRLSAVLEKLRIAPAVDAVEVVHARWERHVEDWRHQIEGNECSACGFVLYGPVGHYCSRCGAKMDGGRDEKE